MFKNSKINIVGYSYDYIPKMFTQLKSFEELHEEFMMILARMEHRKYNVEV